jgi:hypothetical protein
MEQQLLQARELLADPNVQLLMTAINSAVLTLVYGWKSMRGMVVAVGKVFTCFRRVPPPIDPFTADLLAQLDRPCVLDGTGSAQSIFTEGAVEFKPSETGWQILIDRIVVDSEIPTGHEKKLIADKASEVRKKLVEEASALNRKRLAAKIKPSASGKSTT